MAPLRFVLIVANTAAIAVLLAIPIGKLLGLIDEPVGAAAVFGWLIYFGPAAASVLALWGIQFSRSALTRPFVTVAMPGSFLVAALSLAIGLTSPGPPGTPLFVAVATILFGLNVFALWTPFKERVAESTADKRDTDRDT